MLIDTEERRRELAEHAWQLVSELGYAAASVRAVASRAGRNPASVRHVFPGQEALYIRLSRMLGVRMQHELRRMTVSASNPGHALVASLPRDVETIRLWRVRREIVAHRPTDPSSILVERMIAQGIERVGAACVARNILLRPSEAAVAHGLKAIFEGLIEQLVAPEPVITRAQAADAIALHIKLMERPRARR